MSPVGGLAASIRKAQAVSAKTAEKVRKSAAAELGYRPNILARSLITGKSRNHRPRGRLPRQLFLPGCAGEALYTGCRSEGYHVLIFMASQHRRQYRRRLWKKSSTIRSDGIRHSPPSLCPQTSLRTVGGMRGCPWCCSTAAQDDESLSVRHHRTILKAGGRKVAEHPDWPEAAMPQIGYIAGLGRRIHPTRPRSRFPIWSELGAASRRSAHEVGRFPHRPGAKCRGVGKCSPATTRPRRRVCRQRPHGVRRDGRDAVQSLGSPCAGGCDSVAGF